MDQAPQHPGNVRQGCALRRGIDPLTATDDIEAGLRTGNSDGEQAQSFPAEFPAPQRRRRHPARTGAVFHQVEDHDRELAAPTAMFVADTSNTRRPVATNLAIASVSTLVFPVPGGPHTRRTPSAEQTSSRQSGTDSSVKPP